MKAAYYERFGPPHEVLQLGDMTDPQPGPGEVRVRLRWSGINPSDVKQRAGRGMTAMPFQRIVPHSDGMGVVDAVGPDVNNPRVSQRVWVWNAAFERPNGTAAQYVVLPRAQAVPLPDSVPDEVGACLGIPAQTAVQAVLTDGGVVGKRVLVSGGAGAVGFYAIQFARLLGAVDIIATVSSAEKAAIAAEAGATICVNYGAEPVAQRVLDVTHGEGVDRVIEVDVAGNSKIDLEVLKERGTWVCYGSSEREFPLPLMPMLNKALLTRFFNAYRLSPEDRAQAITLLHTWLGRGVLKHRAAERFSLSEAAAAHAHVASGKSLGSVLISID
jgi:NADPH2:quinone reductase